MIAPIAVYDRAIAVLAGRTVENLVLLLVRVVLAGVFWRSGRTKVEPGSLLDISDTTRFLFANDYAGVPLPPDLAAGLATYAEHLFPLLLVLGLFTRLSALALLGMTMVIQIFVYPDAWWPVHSLWVALALVLIVRGGGAIGLDAPLARRRAR